MKQKFVKSLNPNGFHKMAYVEWGNPKSKQTIVCVHGLTRNSRDFDFLAQSLSENARVICPDIVGRGKSDWLAETELYGFHQYLVDLTVLFARLDTAQIDWVGTSMGGLLGMFFASQPNTPVRRLIMNDVGPFVSQHASQRIVEYAAKRPKFQNLKELELYLRKIYAPFGILTDPQWQHLAQHSFYQSESGQINLAYDGKVITKLGTKDIDLWSVWNQVMCPTFVIRGQSSDILTPEVLEEMQKTKPSIETIEISEAGHAPALMNQEQISMISKWLRS